MRPRLGTLVFHVIQRRTGLHRGTQYDCHVHLTRTDRHVRFGGRGGCALRDRKTFLQILQMQADDAPAVPLDELRGIGAAEQRVKHVDLKQHMLRTRRAGERVEQRAF